MTILPFPLWPLAEHAMFGQNGFDASLASVVVCINDSMPMGASFFKSSFPFHRLVESYPKALKELKEEGSLPQSCELRQVKYLNNIVKPGLGFFSFETASNTLPGYERMNM